MVSTYYIYIYIYMYIYLSMEPRIFGSGPLGSTGPAGRRAAEVRRLAGRPACWGSRWVAFRRFRGTEGGRIQGGFHAQMPHGAGHIYLKKKKAKNGPVMWVNIPAPWSQGASGMEMFNGKMMGRWWEDDGKMRFQWEDDRKMMGISWESMMGIKTGVRTGVNQSPGFEDFCGIS